jgi:hypothetical protein
MPLAEIQSQWIAKLIKGTVSLPSPETMNKVINQEAADVAKRYRNSARHTIQVNFHPYKLKLNREMKKYAKK